MVIKLKSKLLKQYTNMHDRIVILYLCQAKKSKINRFNAFPFN